MFSSHAQWLPEMPSVAADFNLKSNRDKDKTEEVDLRKCNIVSVDAKKANGQNSDETTENAKISQNFQDLRENIFIGDILCKLSDQLDDEEAQLNDEGRSPGKHSKVIGEALRADIRRQLSKEENEPRKGFIIWLKQSVWEADFKRSMWDFVLPFGSKTSSKNKDKTMRGIKVISVNDIIICVTVRNLYNIHFWFFCFRKLQKLIRKLMIY